MSSIDEGSEAMDIDTARRLYNEGVREQQQDIQATAELTRRTNARRKYLEGLSEMYPEIKHGPGGRTHAADDSELQRLALENIQRDRQGDPRGKAAARAVLRAYPGTWTSVKGMAEELIKRGWISPDSQDPEAAARQSLYRLADTDQTIERETINGVLAFRYHPPTVEARPIREPVGDA